MEDQILLSISILDNLVHLSGFTSVFEVAFGINAALTVWKGLRDRATNEYNRISEKHISEKLVGKFELPMESPTVTKLNQQRDEGIHTIKRFTLAGLLLSGVLSVLCILILVFCAIAPNHLITVSQGLLETALLTFFSPAYLVIVNLVSKFQLKKFREKCVEAANICDDYAKVNKSEDKIDDFKKIVIQRKNSDPIN